MALAAVLLVLVVSAAWREQVSGVSCGGVGGGGGDGGGGGAG